MYIDRHIIAQLTSLLRDCQLALMRHDRDYDYVTPEILYDTIDSIVSDVQQQLESSASDE
jgi:hypothetical protein